MRRKIKFHCVSMQKQQQNINLSFDNLSHKSWKAFLSGYKMKMWCLLIKDIESMQVKHLANEWLNNLFFTFGLIFLIFSMFSKHQEGEPYTVSKLHSCALYKGWDSFCRHSVSQRYARKHEVIFSARAIFLFLSDYINISCATFCSWTIVGKNWYLLLLQTSPNFPLVPKD